MDGIDPDGELTEFRPWTHFEGPGERQWRPIALAAVVVALAALGWSVWRSAPGPSEVASPDAAVTPNAIVPSAEPPVPTTAVPETTSLPEVIATESQTSSLLSEADLMASAGDTSDLAILALAEEAVIAHFTTAADGELSSSSYVEWARAVAFEKQGETATVAVRFSVVALSDPSWRLPVRTVELTMRPAGDDPLDQWVVEGPPRLLDERQWLSVGADGPRGCTVGVACGVRGFRLDSGRRYPTRRRLGCCRGRCHGCIGHRLRRGRRQRRMTGRVSRNAWRGWLPPRERSHSSRRRPLW